MSKKNKSAVNRSEIVVPAELPAVDGLDEIDEFAPSRRPRTWLWTLLGGLAVVLLLIYLLGLSIMAVIDGLEDRAVLNQETAREHYQAGLSHMEAGEYELAIGEFELALRYDSTLSQAQTQVREAEKLARAQATPTSATLQDAVASLYRTAVDAYQAGKLAEAVTALEDLRSLNGDYQRQNVETMLTTAHYQLGLNGVREDRLGEAEDHFEAVLALNPQDKNALDQLNLMHLYTAALSYWQQDWTATIQALKGLYALAPDYKDVRTRLHDAHVFLARQSADAGNWCAASEEFAGAVSVLPLEETVDQRDDAAIRCQATAQAPQPTATARVQPTPGVPTGQSTGAPNATGTPASQPLAGTLQGRIAFTSYDATFQRHDVYVVDLAEGTGRLLQENADQPAFGPGGKEMVFHNRHPSHLGLSRVALGSGEMIELTAHEEDSAPAWSPDGSQILFASDKHGDRKWRIYVISPGEVRGEGVEWAFGTMPTWSPDGKRVAYHGCDQRGDNCSVWTMNAGGANHARLTKDPSDTTPAWSPNGAQVAFISARAGNWELYLVDAATGQEKRLTDNRAADVAPVWSPDGKRLAFLSNRDGAWAVYVIEVRTGRVQKVIATGDAYPDAVDERLSWMP